MGPPKVSEHNVDHPRADVRVTDFGHYVLVVLGA
jgi:hypothetical protein